jgi:hypothetical protein
MEFPPPARLAQIEQQPAELPPITSGDVPAEGWTVDAASGPPPDAATQPWAPRTSWEQAFAATYATAGRTTPLTRAMACAAGELGRYALRNQSPPPATLQQFFAGACGVLAPEVGFRSLTGTVPAKASDDALLARWKEQLGPDLLAKLPTEARELGFWFGRQGDRAVAMVAYHSTPVELTRGALVPDVNGDLTFEGRLTAGGASYFAGYANQGRFGVSPCLVDPGIVRPRFRVICHMAPEDATAWMQVVYIPPGSVLARPIVEVLARRDATAPVVFTDTPYVAPHLIADAAGFAPAAIAGLNVARVHAGLQPVRLAEAESGTATRVARQYFAATLGLEKEGSAGATEYQTTTTIALGLLAGWQVADGTIRDGTFFSAMVPHTRDASRWLDTALSMPMGRHALLAADIDQVALGPAVFAKPDGLGAVACGYSFHHGNDHSADVSSVLQRITLARSYLHLGPPARLGGMSEVIQHELADVQQGRRVPMSALRASLEEASDRFHTDMRGYVIEAHSLDAFEIPPEIIRQPALNLEVGITHYKPPGAAWAQLVIVVVYASHAGVET